MSRWLDQIKHGMRQQLSKVYKDAKTQATPEDFKEFESFFWKIRPLLEVDFTQFAGNTKAETSDPRPTEPPSDEFVRSPVPDDTFKSGVF